MPGLTPMRRRNPGRSMYDRGSKLRADKHYGFNMPAGKSIQAACTWITVFHGFGGSYTDAKGVPTLNSPAGLRTTKFIVEQLEKISPPGNLTWDFPEMVNACAAGASAQGFMWGGGFSTLLDPGNRWSPPISAGRRRPGGAARRLGGLGGGGVAQHGRREALCRLDDQQGEFHPPRAHAWPAMRALRRSPTQRR